MRFPGLVVLAADVLNAGELAWDEAEVLPGLPIHTPGATATRGDGRKNGAGVGAISHFRLWPNSG